MYKNSLSIPGMNLTDDTHVWEGRDVHTRTRTCVFVAYQSSNTVCLLTTKLSWLPFPY